jgi:hypothetical protein
LNGAIVAADISQSFEEYLEIFDHFYAEDIEGTTDTMKEPVHGKARGFPRSASHVFAEIAAGQPARCQLDRRMLPAYDGRPPAFRPNGRCE